MVRLFQDILQFLWAVLSHWQAYMTGGMAMAAVFVYERLTSKTVSIRVVVGGIIAFLFVAFFLAWRDQYRAGLVAQQSIDGLNGQVSDLARKLDDANRSLNHEKEQNAPKLSGVIRKVLLGHLGDDSTILILIAVKNTGSDSIVEGWPLSVKTGKVNPTGMKPTFVDSVTATSGAPIELKKSDFIYETFTGPLVRGDQKTGWLFYTTPRSIVTFEQLSQVGVEFTVTFMDVNEREYSTPPYEIVEGPGRFDLYWPGGGMPFKKSEERKERKERKNLK